MKLKDLLSLSINNLKRRKLRTFLTVLGVIIGTASIVVMVSLGIGQSELQTEMIESFGSITTISVYDQSIYEPSSNDKEKTYMNDDVLKQFQNIPHVVGVSPVLSYGAICKQVAYESHINIQGVSNKFLEDIELGEGDLSNVDDKTLRFIYGNQIKREFQNSKTGEGYWTTGKEPDIDYNKPMFVIFDKDKYYQSMNGGTDENGNKVKMPKKYIIDTAGVVKGGPEDYNQYCYGVYCNIDALKAQLKSIYRNKPIPGQPTTKKGKALPYFVYSDAKVYVDSMENVMDVQKAITDMGYMANSNAEWVEQNRKSMQVQQAVLGGIGAVSLLVAAIGIANTMMMSIYERTKEIGVMKVLGCDMGNIRDMFLVESGFIGLMGGVIGVTLSFIISKIINFMYIKNQMSGAGAMMSMETVGDISRIPLWLVAFTLFFAVVVGMAAGFFPSKRAMKLSPLAAIRNE